MTSILVTGASGYIGSRLIHSLRNDLNIHAIVRRNAAELPLPSSRIHHYDGTSESIKKIFAQNRIDAVFHLASKAEYKASEENIEQFVSANITFGSQLLEQMTSFGCLKLINTSTFWQEYSKNEPLPICFYAATKTAFEGIIDYYCLAKGLSCISLRLYDVYGPHDPRPKVFQALKNAMNGQPEMSQGIQEVAFTHVHDVIRGYRMALDLLLNDSVNKHERYDLVAKVTTLRDAIETFIRVQKLHVEPNWGALPYRLTQIMKLNPNATLPGWHPHVDIEDGFKDI